MAIKFEIYKRLPAWMRIQYSIFQHRSMRRGRNEKVSNQKKIFVIGEATNGNVGDLALTVAHIDFIRENLGEQVEIVEIPYERFWEKFGWLKRVVTNKDLLTFPGGGNMGDRYVEAEQIRQVCLHVFRKNTTIIFPQTICYDDNSKDNMILEQAKAVYNSHSALCIFAREKKSYEIMQSLFPNCQVDIVPDMVLGYKRIPQEEVRGDRILLCLRSDTEGILKEKDKSCMERICARYAEQVVYTDTFIPGVYVENNTERIQLINEKLREFSQAKIIITDRLHGMVLAYLSNTPCVIMPNYNQKVFGVYQWLSNSRNLVYLEDVEALGDAIDGLIKTNTCVCVHNKETFAEKYKALADVLKEWAKID